MTYKVLVIDDEDRTDLATQLRNLGRDEFEVEALPPPPNLDLERILSQRADVTLVDYELDTRQPDGSLAPYRGLTLAARLREVAPDYPIALLTRSSLPSWSAVKRTAYAIAPVDDVLYKEEDLQGRPDITRAKLLSLARGYRALRHEASRSVTALLQLLATDPTGEQTAREALPPGDSWVEFEAAHWIRSVLLYYPGVLYDEVHAATALGVSAESFKQERFQELFQGARYRGVFSEEFKRWWRHQLFTIGYALCRGAATGTGLRDAFYVAASEIYRLDIARSVDVETGLAPADTVCYLLNIPIRVESSLPYQPDSRPPIMDHARISFKAIRESNDVDVNYIDAASRQCLADIVEDS